MSEIKSTSMSLVVVVSLLSLSLFLSEQTNLHSESNAGKANFSLPEKKPKK